MSSPKVPKSLIEALVEISQIDDAPVIKLHELFVSSSSMIFPDRFKNELNSLSVSPDQRANLEAQLIAMNMFALKHRGEIAASTMHALIVNHLELLDADKLSIEPIANKSQMIWEIASSDSMSRLSKIIDLSYSHPDSLRSAKIVVDARPVFNPDRTAIDTYSILSFLHLNLYRHSEPELLSIYLDESDIRDLKECCEIALEKINQTAKQMANATGNPIFIPGAERLSESE